MQLQTIAGIFRGDSPAWSRELGDLAAAPVETQILAFLPKRP